MKRIIFFFLVFLGTLLPNVCPQEKLNAEQLKELSNQTMIKIYNDILMKKSRYKGLKNFNKDFLLKDDNGVYFIEYTFKDAESKRFISNRAFAFGVSIIRLDETKYFSERGSRKKLFEFGFPLLGLKFQGYKRKGLRSKELDIEAAIQRNGKLLLDEQEKYLPLQLTVKASKESFKINENISLAVILENKSERSYQIKDLNASSLFFVYGDNTTWGAKETGVKKNQGQDRVILKPGRSISKVFEGSGFADPKEIEISCFYSMSIKGVNPSDFLTINVVE